MAIAYSGRDDDQKDHWEIDNYKFVITGKEKVKTRPGELEAIRVERINDKRKTIILFSIEHEYIPVRLKQNDHGHEVLEVN